LLTDIIDQDKLSYIGKQTEDLKAKMHFTPTKALNPEQKFSETVGAYELDELTE
jgi:hypothetical protein